MISFKRKLHSLIGGFEKTERRGSLSYGIFDRDIRKFIVLFLEDLRKNYEDDLEYFSRIEVVEDFFNQMNNSLNGTGWMIWTSINFDLFRELLSEEKISYDRLREIWDYYKHFRVYG